MPACGCDKLHKRTRCRFVMGGGRHNPADVRSAPSNRLSSVVAWVGGGPHIRGVVASAPHHETHLADEFGDRDFEDGEVLIDVRGSRRRADKRHVMKRRDQDAVIEHY